jgi:hypothetical protein
MVVLLLRQFNSEICEFAAVEIPLLNPIDEHSPAL